MIFTYPTGWDSFGASTTLRQPPPHGPPELEPSLVLEPPPRSGFNASTDMSGIPVGGMAIHTHYTTEGGAGGFEITLVNGWPTAGGCSALKGMGPTPTPG